MINLCQNTRFTIVRQENVDQGMDQDGNYARYNPNALGPTESVEYLQTKVGRFERTRAKAIELINLRKASILKASEETDAQLSRLEVSQNRLPLVGQVVLIGAACLTAINLVTGGWAIFQWLRSRRRGKPPKPPLPEGSIELQDMSFGLRQPDSPQRNGRRSLPGRVHARDWQHT
jgi:hypothetical protein